jgi:hypothetical protein
MSSRLKLVLALIGAAGVGTVCGFLLGVRVGVWQFGLLDSSAKASLVTYELQALRAGQTDKIVRAKEISLDGEVLMFCRFLEEGYPWLFWPQNHYFDHARHMKHVANYRKQYPPVAPSMEFAADNPMRDELISYGQDVAGCTKQVVDRYEK